MNENKHINYDNDIEIIKFVYFLYMSIKLVFNSDELTKKVNKICNSIFGTITVFDKLGHDLRVEIRQKIISNINKTPISLVIQHSSQRNEDNVYAKIYECGKQQINPFKCTNMQEYKRKQSHRKMQMTLENMFTHLPLIDINRDYLDGDGDEDDDEDDDEDIHSLMENE